MHTVLAMRATFTVQDLIDLCKEQGVDPKDADIQPAEEYGGLYMEVTAPYKEKP